MTLVGGSNSKSPLQWAPIVEWCVVVWDLKMDNQKTHVWKRSNLSSNVVTIVSSIMNTIEGMDMIVIREQEFSLW